jgi:TnpA family transposase
MPRRRVLTDAQLDALLALPTGEADLIQHYSLSPLDLAVIMKRRRPHNQLGFALQLCALQFPGRLLRPGELVPIEVARFVADQLDIDPGSLADYGTRAPTRYDQLEALHEIFGFRSFSQPARRELSAWLVPIALGLNPRRNGNHLLEYRLPRTRHRHAKESGRNHP